MICDAKKLDSLLYSRKFILTTVIIGLNLKKNYFEIIMKVIFYGKDGALKFKSGKNIFLLKKSIKTDTTNIFVLLYRM